MSRRTLQRLDDIRATCAVIASHLTKGDLGDGLVFDAVRVRLIEIGEAVKLLDPDLLATEPDIPSRQISGRRDQLAHRYFDTSHAPSSTTFRNWRRLSNGLERARVKTTSSSPVAHRLLHI